MAEYTLTKNDDVFTGTADADTFDGYNKLGRTGGTDALDGGAGNDKFILDVGSAGTIDGGADIDTVVANDLGATTYSNVEILDVKSGSPNVLATLAQLDSFGMVKQTSDPTSQIVFNLKGIGGVVDFLALMAAGHSVSVSGDTLASGYMITGTGLNDVIFGTRYNDTLNGGEGDDAFYSNNDAVQAGVGGGTDTVNGGAGNDRFEIQNTAGNFNGGLGDDDFFVDGLSGIVDGGEDTNTLTSSDLGTATYLNFQLLILSFGEIAATIAQLKMFPAITMDHGPFPPGAQATFNLTGSGEIMDFSSVLAAGLGARVYGPGITSAYTLIGTNTADNFYGTQFDDTFDSGGGKDYVEAGAGDDTLRIGADNLIGELYYGGDGFDTLEFYGANYSIDLKKDAVAQFERLQFDDPGAGNTATVHMNAAQLSTPVPFDGEIHGSVRSDILDIAMGDALVLDLSRTFVFGFDDPGDGIFVSGDADSETMVGSLAADTLIGGAGNDDLDGGDNPEGPSGRGDILLGGDGNDTYHVDSGLDLVDEDGYFIGYGHGGTDTIISTADFYWDVASVGEIDRVAEDVVDAGGDGVTLIGGVFDNTLIGHSGTDVLFGRGGSDTYRAGDGVDYISLSTLGVPDAANYVADGHNAIIVDPRASGPYSYDIVYEFDPARDKIDVSNYTGAHDYTSGEEVLTHAVDDGSGNCYIVLGDGFDYVYLVGLEKAQLLASDFIV